MRNIFKIQILACLIVIASLMGCKTTKVMTSVKDLTTLVKMDVQTLADDKMEGRETGTKGEEMAAKYIMKRMESIGLEPKGIGDGYIQVFERRMRKNPHADPSDDDKIIKGKNVIGYIDNGAPYTIIIGAHYDHLGYGGEGSLYVGEPAIHNGADDNASGVAGLLRLASILKKENDPKSNYLFIAFSGEEKGLWGSNFFSKNMTIDKAKVNYMINMDMIGRLNDEKQLAVYGTGTSPAWKNALKIRSAKKFRIKQEESGIGPSDHTSFYLENIPVLHFFTGQHKDYHRPSDDADLINYKGIIEITDFIHDIIKYTKNRGKLRFVKTKDESQEVPDFKVTLGVIPDYLFDGKGMRLDGVKEGRPAGNANLKKGDIIIKMGDLEIVDMMSYMKALGVYEKGQTIDITFIRDGKKITRKLTF